jgi:hypothetical protein
VIPFAPAPKGFDLRSDDQVVAFANPAHPEILLRESLSWGDPTLMIRSVVGVARMLLDDTWTEASAVASGWANLATAPTRGLDLLTIVATLPAPSGEIAA